MESAKLKPLIEIFLLPAIRTLLFIVTGLLLVHLPAFRGNSLTDVSKWWPVLVIIVNLITIFLLFILVRRRGKSFGDLINPDKVRIRRVKDILSATALMLVLGIGGLWIFSFLVYGYMPLTNMQQLPLWAAIVVSVLLPGTIIFAEIPFYLGYCSPLIKKVTGNEIFSIIYPLFFFALQHSFMPLIFDIKHIISRFLVFIPLLVMIGLWYSRKKDLVPLMTGHGILDAIAGIQILLISYYPSIIEMMSSGLT